MYVTHIKISHDQHSRLYKLIAQAIINNKKKPNFIPYSRYQSGSIIIKIFQLCIFAILLVMVIVQFNDPDPLFWATVYGSCALVPAIAFFQKNNKPLFYISLALCVIALSISFEGALEYTHHVSKESLLQPMSADKLYIEKTREFLGTLIALLLISTHQFILSRQHAK